MTPPPVGPAEPMVCLVNRSADQGDEESLDFVAGQRDQVVGAWAEMVLVGADDGQEGVGEHGKGDPAGPGRIAAELVWTNTTGAPVTAECLRPHGTRWPPNTTSWPLACPSPGQPDIRQAKSPRQRPTRAYARSRQGALFHLRRGRNECLPGFGQGVLVCFRVQPLAFAYASRMFAGTRPRSLIS